MRDAPCEGLKAPAAFGLPRRAARPLRYLAVASVGAGVQAVVVAASVALGCPPVLATVLGIEAAILHNFAWHDRWTWGDRPRVDSRARRLVRYNTAMAGSSLLVGAVVSWAVLDALGGGIVAANAAAVAGAAVVNYAASDRLIFRSGIDRGPARRGLRV